MSQITALKVPFVKLSLPDGSPQGSSYTPSIKESDSKLRMLQNSASVKSIAGSHHKGKYSVAISATQARNLDKTPVSTAATKARTISSSPKKAIKGQTDLFMDTPTAVKVISRKASSGPSRLSKRSSQQNVVEPVPEPVVQVQQEQPEVLAAEITEKLYKVFQFYTSFAERSNVAYLKSHRFNKMMIDAEVRNESLNQSSLDLLFVSELKHNASLNFDRFLSLLTRVAKVKYEGTISDPEAYDLLLKQHMLPLYDKIYKEADRTSRTSMSQEVVEEGTRMVFNTVSGTLQKIFNVYFPFDIQTGNDPQVVRQRMENALFIFLREFDLCPGIINKGTAYNIWTDVLRATLETPVEQDDLSMDQSITKKTNKTQKASEKNLPFSFERFKLLLTRIANIGLQDTLKDTETKSNQPERAIQLLERMDLAFRVLNSDKKSASPFGGKASLLIPQDALIKIQDFLLEKQKENRSRSGKGSDGKSRVIVTSGTKYEDYNIVDEGVILLFEKHYHALLKIFQFYSSFGEPLNTTKLHAFKFNKLLKEAQLVENNTSELAGHFRILQGIPPAANNTLGTITTAEADVVVAALTGPKQTREINEKKMNYDPNVMTPFIGYLNYLYKNNPLNLAIQNRLEYEAFLKAIEMISQKLLPQMALPKAVKLILEKNLLKLEKEVIQVQKTLGSKPLKALVDLLQDFKVVEFLGVVHKSMMQYYKFYADTKGMMNIEKFMQFCREFSVFPDVISKGKLCTFFHALAGVRAQAEDAEVPTESDETQKANKLRRMKSEKAIGQQEDELIDQHMFIQALAVCALEVPYLNPQPSDMQKIFNFLEKLNQSQGSVIVRKECGLTRTVNGLSWDIMFEIRKSYPELFLEPVEEEPLSVDKFEALVQQNAKKGASV